MAKALEAETSGDDRGILRGVEQELIEKAAGGDRAAFDRLVESHLQKVWNVVWRMLRHREDAEDVVQEVFLTAYKALPSFRGDSSFSTWLHRIAVTRALNYIDRSAERIARASRSLEVDAEDDFGSASATIALDAAPSPLQALEAKELMRRLSECLGKLPAAWRAVVALRDSESRSYEEIAALLGVALGTVRSRLARARLSLRECVEGRSR